MITGKKQDLTAYKGLGTRIDRAIDYLLAFDPATPDGHYEIDGENLYANVVTVQTSTEKAVCFEAHRRYIDLQYILDGSETMVYAPLSVCRETQSYRDAEDYAFYEADGKALVMNAGDFYLVHPFDAHAPGRYASTEKVRKIVIKIKL